MIVTITINPQTRAGKINTPYLTAHTVETFCFAAAPSPTEEIPDGTAVALLTPDRKTLAMSFVQGGCVTLNTNTQQAADYFLGCAVNEPKNAALVVGDTDSIQTIIPVIVRANPLDDLAPPPPLAPNYPTSDELDRILQRVLLAERSATESAQKAQTSAETATAQAGLASLSKTKAEIVYENVAASVDGGTIRDPETGEDVKTVPGYKMELSMTKESYIGELSRAKDVFSGDLDSHTENLKEELSGEKDAAVQAVQNKAAEVSGDLDGKVTAAQNAVTAAGGHATAASNSASAALQSASAAAGSATAASKSAAAADASYKATLAIQEALGPAPWKSVYAVQTVTDSIVLDATKKFYSVSLTASAYAVVIDTSALSLDANAVEFRLHLKAGETASVISFPASVQFVDVYPTIDPGSETLLSFVSMDGGSTWWVRTLYNKQNYTTRSYSQNGLLAHWDAIENVGRGQHDPDAKNWVDLITGTEAVGTDGAVFGEDYYFGQTWQWLTVDLAKRADIADSYLSGQTTVELVLSVDEELYPSTGYPVVVGCSNGAQTFSLYCKANGRWGGWVFGSSFNYDRATQGINPRTLSLMQNLDGQKYNLYENAISRAGGAMTAVRKQLGSALFIGRDGYVGGDTQYFQGKIHAIRWYNRPLSVEEISYHTRIDQERFGE